ncbi:alpha/beta hydrolase [Nocardioides sp. B-3]|uniref:alpha/beta hydrolase n=1 Tax=Nocardioides sp. B-3 TaxID=2895565 RepID=UPI0021522F16|nr:alpha/beta hydrolase [Nocardioides sp. B-3]UUZ59189.1 alpha/beta hydrolase [Nocardioides sp. B-3]
MPDAFRTDVLGRPYVVENIELPDDGEGPVVATLVRKPTRKRAGKAVLHVHGFADYFFHREYAEWWTARGYTFYAIDLRKYGRSLREHQTPNFVEDPADYFPELDAARQRITERDGHTSVVATAHSTGGLTLPLWLDERRPPELSAMFLNAPRLDMQGSARLRNPAAAAALNQLGARQPHRLIPRTVNTFYGRSLHRDHEGEFDYNFEWKPLESYPVYAGWLRAIRRGHGQIHRGLDIKAPTLVLSSGRTVYPKEMGEDVHTNDIVPDVQQIRRWASSLGSHVTSIGIDGARHDVVLSRPEVRVRVYAEIDRWLTAYVEKPA